MAVPCARLTRILSLPLLGRLGKKGPERLAQSQGTWVSICILLIRYKCRCQLKTPIATSMAGYDEARSHDSMAGVGVSAEAPP